MAKYYSLDNPRAVVPAESGDSYVVEYELEYSPQGVPHLVEVGGYDLYEVIQSFAAECDLNKILQRYASGDVYALNKAQGVYMDTSGIPDNVNDAVRLMDRVRSIYDNLGADIKSRIGDFGDFISNPAAAFETAPESPETEVTTNE